MLRCPPLFLLIAGLRGAALQAQIPEEAIPLTAEVHLSPPSATIHWASDPTADSYRVYYRAPEAAGWNFAVQLPGSATSFTDTNFPIGDAWEYMVTRDEPYPLRSTVCVPVGTSLTFRITDSGGDGLCCAFAAGAWHVDACGGELARGGSFGTVEQSTFTVCGTSGCTDVTVVVEPDQFVDAVSWELRTGANVLLASGGPLAPPRFGLIRVGIQVPAVDQPGSVLILVADNLANPLQDELERLRNDLEAEGWRVQQVDVPLSTSVTAIKAQVVAARATDPGLNALLIIGGLAVPYSGRIAPDGHFPDHYGAWPADLYYAELDGPWTDNSINIAVTELPVRNQNVPGDGKFDQSVLPSDVDLMLGRIDLSDLPAFVTNEVELTRSYLDRNHAFRTAQVAYQRRAVVDENFPFYDHESTIYRSCTPMFGAANVQPGDLLTVLSTQRPLWSLGAGAGSFTSIQGVGATEDLASEGTMGAFAHLFGSYFGDWDNSDNFMRAALASGLLGAVWGPQEMAFHEMALNAPIGQAVRRSQNASYADNGRLGRLINIDLMGDPTLVPFPVPPVTDLSTDSSESGMLVSWTAAPEADLGYRIYRRGMGPDSFTLIGSTGSTQFLDPTPLVGGGEYLVRPLDMDTSSSGTYQRLGPGRIVASSLSTGSSEVVQGAGFAVFPVPNQGRFMLRAQGRVGAVRLFDLEGRAVPVRTEISGDRTHVLADATPGCYVLQLSVDGVLHNRRVLITE
ncbi:MAG TPA: hypothetical protein VGE21_14585 [Flavobacteriales bacterium]